MRAEVASFLQETVRTGKCVHAYLGYRVRYRVGKFSLEIGRIREYYVKRKVRPREDSIWSGCSNVYAGKFHIIRDALERDGNR